MFKIINVDNKAVSLETIKESLTQTSVLNLNKDEMAALISALHDHTSEGSQALFQRITGKLNLPAYDPRTESN